MFHGLKPGREPASQSHGDSLAAGHFLPLYPTESLGAVALPWLDRCFSFRGTLLSRKLHRLAGCVFEVPPSRPRKTRQAPCRRAGPVWALTLLTFLNVSHKEPGMHARTVGPGRPQRGLVHPGDGLWCPGARVSAFRALETEAAVTM